MGHLTATSKDSLEVDNYKGAGRVDGLRTDHRIVGVPLYFGSGWRGKCGDHPPIADILYSLTAIAKTCIQRSQPWPDPSRIPTKLVRTPLNIVAGVSFGFWRCQWMYYPLKSFEMHLRYARHTNQLAPLIDFYCGLLDLNLGEFHDHDGYDGVFIRHVVPRGI